MIKGNTLKTKISQTGIRFLVLLSLVLMVAGPAATPVSAYVGVPTFSIVSIVEDTSVTIQTYNFPAGETFTVRMGAFGTLGIGGEIVGTTTSGSGGSFQETYTIPASLAGDYQIAIRMDSASGTYYAYNWFINNETASSSTTTYYGVPTFSIVSAVTDTTVTVRTYNFPANVDFTVRMGEFGTKAIGGTVVATTNSGSGGSFEVTYDIPAAYAGDYQIAIRMDSADGFYYAYNWFYNDASASSSTTTYYGVPTFSIVSAVTDTTVTVRTYNFPANVDFTVRMGEFGTKAVGGTVVATTNSGSGGSFEVTYDIPAAYAGDYQIALRMDSADGYYYAYNWFYNDTSASSSTTTYTGVPTFSIVSEVSDTSVTIQTYNFPADVDFTVRMGQFGTKAIGGTVVATTNSGSGGSFQVTYDIPAAYAGLDQIAIRIGQHKRLLLRL